MDKLNITQNLLKIIALKFKDNKFLNEKKIIDQISCLFLNRIIQDINASLLLSNSGYFGSARTLLAVTHRNLMMYASLIDAEEERINSFWNEESDTYQDKTNSFKKDFSEENSRKLAQKSFEKEAFLKSEFEKSLHGSCFALRKYYTDRAIDNGLKTAVVTFEPFKNNLFEEEIKNMSEAYILDFLGVFFTKYINLDYLKEELELYYTIAKITKSMQSHEKGQIV